MQNPIQLPFLLPAPAKGHRGHHKGEYHPTEATIKKQSESLKATWARKRALGLLKKQYHHSDEVKKRLSDMAKARWARKKAPASAPTPTPVQMHTNGNGHKTDRRHSPEVRAIIGKKVSAYWAKRRAEKGKSSLSSEGAQIASPETVAAFHHTRADDPPLDRTRYSHVENHFANYIRVMWQLAHDLKISTDTVIKLITDQKPK